MLEHLAERKDARLGGREKCSGCGKGTPQDEIWFCLSCGASEPAEADAEDEEAGASRGLQALCPACTIKHHNGHKVVQHHLLDFERTCF